MKWTSLNDIREKYLSFFESKGHLRHESYSLIPEDDKSLLLIVAGMAPLKKYFTGEAEPPRRRMTTCQRCIRTNDIENVGITARHGTFFEMLGNFSFGDYFKEEALPWAWEFLTSPDWLDIPAEKLYPSIYKEDDEAFEIWNKKIGVPAERIVRLGKEDNFWEHGSGPCGPCSEIYFDRGEKYGCGKPTCGPGCDCDRFMEIWNNVFSQFNNDGNGNYTELAQKNIDTGMGLERLACVMQGVDSMFDVDTIQNIISAISKKAGVKYGDNPKADISLRIIADHMRACSFLIADGVIPSNEGRGYVLRRLLRRACRHGRLLGIEGAFLNDIVTVVAKENESEYMLLTNKLDYIHKIVGMEEERFDMTVESGTNLLESIIADAKKNGSDKLSGADVFKLSDTFGFPIDLTREIAEENGLGVDEDGFRALMNEQKGRARAARGNISGWDNATKSLISEFPTTDFKGYESTETDAKVLAIIVENEDGTQSVDEISEGDFTLVLDKTVFYGEGGGQVGDIGEISAPGMLATVTDTKKTNGIYLHICSISSGALHVGDTVSAKIEKANRAAIARNHSAVHLLDAALRQVLGDHIRQAGSYVDAVRGRFDFTHFAPVTKEELEKIELLVNEKILENLAVNTEVTDVESAKNSGAIALFGEKYGSVVRVVRMGSFSSELCGGTHVSATGNIGQMRIISESSVAAGTRRIEIATGLEAYEISKSERALISKTLGALKTSSESEIVSKITSMQDELKKAQKDLEGARLASISSEAENAYASASDVKGVKVLSVKTSLPVDTVRTLSDNIKSKHADAVAVISSLTDGKLTLVCVIGKDALAKGVKAPEVLKALYAYVGGGGGGRPDSATAGAKDPSKLDAAFAALNEIVSSII
ncbi:MAG: alanine--tRNA ligase [Clostridiales bacterium]|nr:alanine--tRNA ligase [Clostridiales bacterium]